MMNIATSPAVGANSTLAFDLESVRADFPILSRKVYGQRLVYLDSGASAQKPEAVLGTMDHIYRTSYSNVHRGAHCLGQEVTEAFEASRQTVADFIGAASSDEITFTRGTTEAINLVASSYGRGFLKEGDEVILSVMEHHSNIVPWQLLRDQIGIVIRVVSIDPAGNLLMEDYKNLLNERTKLVAMTHISNALGTVVPIAEIIRLAHDVGARVLVDGSQAVPHRQVDVRALDADFYVFTGHKAYGPSGIGVLYGKRDLLNAMPPYQGGGEMIRRVTFEETTYQDVPHRFEAGTPAIVEAIGLGAALRYLDSVGQDAIEAHEAGILAYATERLGEIPGLTIHGQAQDKASIISMTMEGLHAHDIGTIVDRAGVAVRAGHHCAQPLMDHLGIPATARASFGIYNGPDDVDALVAALEKARDIFG